MKKRILSLVLMISMVVMLLPTTVFANANVIERTLDIVYNGPSKICVEQDFTFSYTIPDNYRSDFSFIHIGFDNGGFLYPLPDEVSRNGQTFTATFTSERLKSRAGNNSSCVVFMGADHNSGGEYGNGYIKVAIEIGHIDVNKDHVCDVETCKATVGTCEDADKDHKCDYGCGKDFGTHVDADLNHICDYGCDEAIGICADADKNHKCDYGCGKTFGVCSGGTATCKDKAVCDYCGKPYGEVDSNNHDLENIKENAATVTETGNTEYWHCKDCDNNFSDESGKTAIDLKDTVTPKLPPEIIDGKGQSLTAGEKKELTFRSNAAYSDFIRVEVDGETVDENNYTVKEGSAIVTLKADYVATLSVGEHTLGIVSESGTATTTFTVNAKVVNDNTSPATGDNSHMTLWLALLFVSGGLLTVTGVYGKKRKYSAK